MELASESKVDEYCLMLCLVDESEVISVYVASDQEMLKGCLPQLTSERHKSSFNWIVARCATWFPLSFLELKTNWFPCRNGSPCTTAQSWNVLNMHCSSIWPQEFQNVSGGICCCRRWPVNTDSSKSDDPEDGFGQGATPKCYGCQYWGSMQ